MDETKKEYVYCRYFISYAFIHKNTGLIGIGNCCLESTELPYIDSTDRILEIKKDIEKQNDYMKNITILNIQRFPI